MNSKETAKLAIRALEDKKAEDIIPKIKSLDKLAAERGQTLAEMSLAWLLKDEHVSSVIIGASSVAQLDDNLRALRHTDFEDEELARIEEICRRPDK